MPNLLSAFCIAEVLHGSLDWLTGRSPAISDTELKAEELLINGKIKFKTTANVGYRGYIPGLNDYILSERTTGIAAQQ